MRFASAVRVNTALRLPVTQVVAELHLGSGTSHGVCMYVPVGQSVEDVLRSSSWFIPATEGDQFRLFARSDIACVTLFITDLDWHVDLPMQQRDVRVHLINGQEIAGHIRVVFTEAHNRTADHLNSAENTFALYAEDRTHYVAKSHVAFVEELS